jgi:DNA-binding SARP family transcriptional activator
VDIQARPGGAPTADRPTALLQIHLLGRFEVVRGGAPIPPQAWRRRRPADLLRLVALSPGHSVAREVAIDALWPDKDPDSGANNLHRALYDLRQILGGRWVDIERGRISLRPEAWVDVDAFERAIEAGGSEGFTLAVSLYRGDLSPEDVESPWLGPRRAALRGRFAEAAFPRALELAGGGDPGAAVALLRRLLRVSPASEEAHRLLMRLLAETGRRADALRQYDACEAALQRAALGPPGPETRTLRDAIQDGRVGASTARASPDGAIRAARRLLGSAEPPPLRGRAAAVLLLESLLEEGAGAVVLLGEAGVGKTRLAV